MKTQGKITNLHQMIDLVVGAVLAAPDALGAVVYALSAPARIEGHPPFAPADRAAGRDPRGGHAAPLSLPLLATPFSISQGHEVQK